MDIFSDNYCRFCLKESFRELRMFEIDDSIEQLFCDLTQLKLSTIPNLSNSICEECFKDLTKCVDTKKLFVGKQTELERRILCELNGMDVKSELESESISTADYKTVIYEKPENETYIDHENTIEMLSQSDEIYEQNQSILTECPHCLNLFEQSEIVKHIRTHQEIRNRYECELCPYSTPKNDRFQRHYLKVHNIDAPVKKKATYSRVSNERQQCAVCGSFVKNLVEHLKFTHNQAKKSYFCDHCNYSCYFKTKIERHLQKHIPKEFRNLIQCPDCNFLCSRKDALKSHIMTMHQIDRQKTSVCPHCKKSFYNTSQLNIHVRSVHQNVRDHLCQHCGKGFFTPKDLKIHAARHFEKKEKCSQCDSLFFCKVDLRRHFRHKHLPASIECNLPNCHRKFHTNSQLKIHIKTRHENLKEYICNYCGSNFGQYNNMKRHIDSVHKALRIHCPVENCNYSITRKDKYKIHLIKVHKNFDEKMRQIILKNVKYE